MDINHTNHGASTPHTPRGGPTLFPVGIPKLVLLSFASGGLYLFYWMYRQWKAIRDYSGMDISPSSRAMFTVIWCVPLFKELRTWTGIAAVAGSVPAELLAGIFLALQVGCPLLAQRLDSEFLWLVSYLYVIPVAMMQKEVNAYIRQVAPNADMNQRYSAWNIVVILVGIVLLLIVAVVPEHYYE